MYSQYEDLLAEKQGRKLGESSWSCNCQNKRRGRAEIDYITMHQTQVNGEGICVLCGHYAYKIENHILNAERSKLHVVYKGKR